jgi:Arc-like DNA binding domain
LNDDLFIKRMPLVIKELIAHEAAQNHRSVNQEAIALLEEALLSRVENQSTRRRNVLATLATYAAQMDSPLLASLNPTPLAPQAAQPAGHFSGGNS